MKKVVRRVLPWCVAIGLMVLLVRRTGGAALRDALLQVDVVFLLAATAACTLANFLLDSYSLSRCLSWFHGPIPWRQVAPVKAAAYLIGIVNYNVASGGIAFWVSRIRKVPFLEAVSSLLFVNVVDALLLVALMVTGLPYLESPVFETVQVLGVVAAVGFVAQFGVWRLPPETPIIGGVLQWPIFASFRHAHPSHYAVLGLWRLAFISVFILNYWFAVLAFGLDIRLLHVIAAVPVISFVGIVPITVAGLGTVQAATIYVFRDQAPEAALLALSLAVTAAMTAMRALLGLPFLGRVSDQLFSGENDPAEVDDPK